MMMRLVTLDDIIDVYLKARQRGLAFIFSKFNTNSRARTQSAFNKSAILSSNWWIIPKIRERWNSKITGLKNLEYEKYVVEKYLSQRTNIRMLSIGSGICSHEFKFAQYPSFDEIVCIDISKNLMEDARKKAADMALKNMKFTNADFYEVNYRVDSFDMIMFHSSLHHFSGIPELISKIKKWLRPNGILLINEYVGKDRLQFEKSQIDCINEGLKLIPNNMKRRYKSKLRKRKFRGSGYIRMLIADPSECIESSKILPAIHKEFEVIEEKPFGGNLLMHILKDISHHFVDSDNPLVTETLEKLFELEDAYLVYKESDFVFGLYRNRS